MCDVTHPDIFVYLAVDVDISIERVARRGREFENDIDAQFIAEISRSYKEMFESVGSVCGNADIMTLDTTYMDAEQVFNVVSAYVVEKLESKSSGCN